MMEFTTIGLDLAKRVFQVHTVNGKGEVVVRKRLCRAQVLRFFEQLAPCLKRAERATLGHVRSQSLAMRYV
jgi:transposase